MWSEFPAGITFFIFFSKSMQHFKTLCAFNTETGKNVIKKN
jgi:hypothetical protein